ncbi:amidase, partial [Bombardia bombarda]
MHILPRSLFLNLCGGILLMCLFPFLRQTFNFNSTRNMATHTTLPSLLHLTIEEAAEGLRSGLFTTVDLTKAYLKRIDEVTELNAILQLNPDALTVAHELDERARSGNGKSLGPLHGLPILVKDSIATADKLEASAGSFALLGAKPKTESSVIAKLRKAGVLVLGKTNMSEFANFRGLNISPGWSPRGGQTLGAYYPDCTPEGSSSGSAVAAALGLSTAAIGAETWGSITEPAEFNNVVGLKPSRGLVANDGVVPISSDQDVVGTLTRTVKDAAYMLNIMAGRSEQDKGTWSIPFEQIPDYTTFCGGTDLRGVTIGVPRNAFPSDPTSPIMISFEAALKTLATAGATVVDNADFSDAKGFMKYNQEIRGIVRSSANNRDMPAYLETLEHNPNNLRSSGDIKAWIEEHPELEDYPLRDTGKLAWMLKEGINVDSDKYKDMLEKEKYYGGPGGIVGAMEKYQLDLLAVPSSWGIANDLASKMGFPALSVPLGFFPEGTAIKREDMHPNLIRVAPGIPYSMVLISQSFREPDLLRVAHAFEELVGVRANGPAPYKVPRTELKDVVAGMMSFESLDSHSRAILG